MLLFIEHDAVMATAEARKALADFVGHRPGINLAVFHAADESDDDVLAAYPAALRERLLLTPQTPRARDLCFWLAYEAGCVWAALRSNGQLTQCEAWVTLVPPAWEKPPARSSATSGSWSYLPLSRQPTRSAWRGHFRPTGAYPSPPSRRCATWPAAPRPCRWPPARPP